MLRCDSVISACDAWAWPRLRRQFSFFSRSFFFSARDRFRIVLDRVIEIFRNNTTYIHFVNRLPSPYIFIALSVFFFFFLDGYKSPKFLIESLNVYWQKILISNKSYSLWETQDLSYTNKITVLSEHAQIFLQLVSLRTNPIPASFSSAIWAWKGRPFVGSNPS